MIRTELNEALNRSLGGDELFDEVPDTTYFVKDAGARYHFVNTTLVGRCGKTLKSDLLGKTAAEVFPSPLGDEFEGQDRRILEGGAAIRSQLELHIYPDGRQGWCLTWKRALRDEEGEIVGLSGISRDVDGAKSSPLDLEALAKVLNYIRAHLDGPLRLGELAEATGLSFNCDPPLAREGKGPSEDGSRLTFHRLAAITFRSHPRNFPKLAGEGTLIAIPAGKGDLTETLVA